MIVVVSILLASTPLPRPRYDESLDKLSVGHAEEARTSNGGDRKAAKASIIWWWAVGRCGRFPCFGSGVKRIVEEEQGFGTVHTQCCRSH